MSQFASHWLGSHSASPGIARAHTAQFVRGALGGERRGVASLLVSELVTNAVTHGRAPIRLALTLDTAALRIEVTDAEPNIAAVRTRDENGGTVLRSGRGLRIVGALADHWGVTGYDECKTVWAQMSIAPNAPTRGDGSENGSRR